MKYLKTAMKGWAEYCKKGYNFARNFTPVK